MQVSDELLSKYFKGQCTKAEKLLVTAYLNETEELPDHLLSKNEWDAAPDAILTEAKTEEMFDVIMKQTSAKTYRFKWLKIGAAAAAIFTVLTIGLLNLNKDQPVIPSAQQTITSIKKVNELQWKSVVNYTEQTQLLTLPDQSIVKIYPGGELRYTLPFVDGKREIYLKGKSFFQVMKDDKHPFIVYAKGISTTALGTSFTITATEKSKLIKVQLHTGKVLVKDADSTRRTLTFNKILKPGTELVYNSQANHILVKTIKPAAANKADGLKELYFTQAPLVDVFAKLQRHYKITISYNPDDLQEMSFTGSLQLTQPIDTILEEIAKLNKLNQTKTTKGYLISK